MQKQVKLRKSVSGLESKSLSMTVPIAAVREMALAPGQRVWGTVVWGESEYGKSVTALLITTDEPQAQGISLKVRSYHEEHVIKEGATLKESQVREIQARWEASQRLESRRKSQRAYQLKLRIKAKAERIARGEVLGLDGTTKRKKWVAPLGAGVPVSTTPAVAVAVVPPGAPRYVEETIPDWYVFNKVTKKWERSYRSGQKQYDTGF